MRKRLIAEGTERGGTAVDAQDSGAEWLDLDELAEVEISSEDPQFPIEDAFSRIPTAGWRASKTGPQTIRLIFEQPVKIRRIRIRFAESSVERSQEFALYAQSAAGGLREIRRQQFTFSPGGSTEELEDYAVELDSITGLELKIDPDRSHDPNQSQAYATLASLRLG